MVQSFGQVAARVRAPFVRPAARRRVRMKVRMNEREILAAEGGIQGVPEKLFLL